MSNEHESYRDVAKRAAALWQEAGGPPGRDLEFWLQAESEVAGTSAVPVAGQAPAAVASSAARKRDDTKTTKTSRSERHRAGGSAKTSTVRGH